MQIIELALKDLRQILRDRRTLIFMLLMPIAFTFFFGWLFGDAGAEDPRLPVGLVIEDQDNLITQELLAMIEDSRVIRPQEIAFSEANNLVESQEIAGAIVIPSELNIESLLDASSVITLVVNPVSPAGQTVSTALSQIVERLRAAAKAASISLEQLISLEGEPDDPQAYLQEAFRMGMDAWETPPISIENNVQISDEEAINSFTQSSPGMIVQFAIFGLTQTAVVLVLERNSGALRRLMASPIPKAGIILGHVLSMFLITFLQLFLLVVFGELAFKLGYFDQLPATVVIVACLALWSASLGLLVSALSKTQEHVILYGMIAMFLFSALGGAWFPLEITGETFAAVGRWMPSAWAMEGFQNLILRGMGFDSIITPALILIGYTIAFLAIAVWRFKFE
jgi:ABC-2 type transport system permease protein